MVTDSASTMYSTNPSYDAAGDVTQDGANTYRYDAEGRVCAVESTPVSGYTSRTGYIYNAEGVRVAKGTLSPSGALSCDPSSNGFQLTESYVLGPGGEELTMVDYDAGGNRSWRLTNVYAAGKLVGTYDASGLHLHVSDPLGSRRMQISGNVATAGQPETEFQSMPYGNLLGTSTDPGAPYDPDNPYIADDASPLHFTGKERDTESGNDYFGARYYASSMGRWMSPDWSAKAEPVPYARLDDPQTLNLYVYLRNNPLAGVDADGHCGDLCQIFGNAWNGRGFRTDAQVKQYEQKMEAAAKANIERYANNHARMMSPDKISQARMSGKDQTANGNSVVKYTLNGVAKDNKYTVWEHQTSKVEGAKQVGDHDWITPNPEHGLPTTNSFPDELGGNAHMDTYRFFTISPDSQWNPNSQTPVLIRQGGQDYQFEHIENTPDGVLINGSNHLQ